MTLTAPAPRVVTPFESRLLRILHAIVRHAPPDPVLTLISERPSRPPTLSRTCVDLVADSLAKGCMTFLVRAGGWRRDWFLHDGQPRDGRLWERWGPANLGFAFSSHTLEFLIWITAHRPGDRTPSLELPSDQLTPADRLLLFLSYDLIRETDAGPALRAVPAIAQDGLIRLACAEDFAGIPKIAGPEFAPWLTGLGAAMFEALQPLLCDRWVTMERQKAQIGDWTALRDLGLVQEQVLTAFVEAVEKADRPDLVRFLLRAAAAVLSPSVSLESFVGGLQGSGPPRLADRVEVHRRASPCRESWTACTAGNAKPAASAISTTATPRASYGRPIGKKSAGTIWRQGPRRYCVKRSHSGRINHR